MQEGLRLVLGNPVLSALALGAITRSFFGGTFAALYGLYVIRVLKVTPAVFGLLVGMGGVGALLGAFLAGPLARRCGIAPVLIGSTLLSSALMLATPLARGPQVVVVLLLMFSQLLGDCAYEVSIIHSTSLLQVLVPQSSLGRASAGMQFLTSGMVPLGALLSGVVAAMLGMRVTLLIASLLAFLLSSAWLIFSPLRRGL
jgi:predicted MFS family arabinose efflux permease